MKIKNPETKEHVDLYSAILKFAKKKNGQISKNIVRIIIRYGKKGPTRKRDIGLPNNPKHKNYIDTGDLEWTKYQGKPISVYHRANSVYLRTNEQNYDYVNSKGIIASTNLCQKLEDLVQKVCFKKSKKE